MILENIRSLVGKKVLVNCKKNLVFGFLIEVYEDGIVLSVKNPIISDVFIMNEKIEHVESNLFDDNNIKSPITYRLPGCGRNGLNSCCWSNRWGNQLHCFGRRIVDDFCKFYYLLKEIS